MFNPASFVQYKDLPNIQSMFGNIGNSWNNPLPNDLFIKGIPKIIFKDQSTTKLTNGGNVGGGLDSIFTFTYPASSFKTDGDFSDYWLAGNFAANDNNKRVRLEFDTTQVEDLNLQDIDALGWLLYGRISRVSNTAVFVMGLNLQGALAGDSAATFSTFSVGGYFVVRPGAIGVTGLLTNSKVLEVKAEGTANDDITINQAIITLTRF